MLNWRAWGPTGLVALILFLISTALFFGVNLRHPLRSLFAPPERKILSVAIGKIFPDGEGRVVKLLTPEGLVLEVYGPHVNNAEALIDRMVLSDRRDAQFQFKGRATNLALKDLNGDQVFEIIAPSYDSSLVPHLNIFRYNKDSSHFEPYTE